MKLTVCFAPVLLLLLACAATPNPKREVHVASNAPADRPIAAHGEESAAEFQNLIASYIAKARETYPDAKQRFLAGLPHGQSFFVTARITDAAGNFENTFIAVDEISSGRISGRIWNDIQLVQGWRFQDRYELAESDIIDWLITKPDGTEEGNFVGKFMDTLPR